MVYFEFEPLKNKTRLMQERITTPHSVSNRALSMDSVQEAVTFKEWQRGNAASGNEEVNTRTTALSNNGGHQCVALGLIGLPQRFCYCLRRLDSCLLRTKPLNLPAKFSS